MLLWCVAEFLSFLLFFFPGRFSFPSLSVIVRMGTSHLRLAPQIGPGEEEKKTAKHKYYSGPAEVVINRSLNNEKKGWEGGKSALSAKL